MGNASPNMPTLETATVYPGNVSVRRHEYFRGTWRDATIRIFGAPFIDAEKLCTELSALKLPGVFFRENYFQPTFQKFAGQLCAGAQIHVIDRERFPAVSHRVEIIKHIRNTYPEHFQWKQPPYE